MPRRSSSDQLILGAAVVRRLTSMHYPMIMVDRITAFATAPQPRLTAEKYISANEPVFEGHFPDQKIWPGIHTIEGLRQCCAILDALQTLDDKGLIHDIETLESGHAIVPLPTISGPLHDALAEVQACERLPIRIRVKLLAPVLPGSVMEYQVTLDPTSWSVSAEVDGRLVARGEIS